MYGVILAPSGLTPRLQKQEQADWPNTKNDDEIKKLKGKLRRLELSLPVMEQKERRLQSRNKYFEVPLGILEGKHPRS